MTFSKVVRTDKLSLCDISIRTQHLVTHTAITMSFTFHDIRQLARKAQNSLITQSQFETKLREVTNTDTWLPSPRDLSELLDISTTSELNIDDQIAIVFERIHKYLNNSVKRRSLGEELYNKAVHYVNSGNEWRIILKCVKVIEFFILHDGSDDLVHSVLEYLPELERVGRKFENHSHLQEPTSAALERQKNFKTVHYAVSEVLHLLKDHQYRNEQIVKITRIDHSGIKNDVEIEQKANIPRGYKEKKLDRSKVQNSNLKSEVKNYVGHSFRKKERLPGKYSAFNSFLDNEVEGGNGYDEDESYSYGDEHKNVGFHDDGDYEGGDHDSNVDDSHFGKFRDDEEDEFGEFQNDKSTGLLTKSNKSTDLVSL